jgi:Dolichyl-phosphate-mannose-protein mannosyltransferase
VNGDPASGAFRGSAAGVAARAADVAVVAAGAAVRAAGGAAQLIDERERRVLALGSVPAFSGDGRARLWAWLRAHVTDEWAVALLAAALSIGFFVWYETHGLTLAFNDARIRELISRRVIFGRTPGLGQLGTTWLPLPSLLMLPFIWSDTLFRSGLAGSLPSMGAYVLGGVYMYRTGRLVAGSRAAGWLAALVLLLNPSLLYMQSTAMSEVPSLTAFVIAIYYAVRVAETHHASDLVKCAAAVAAGTLIRYDDWILAFALVPVLALIAWRHRGYLLAEAWTILFGLLAFAGCAAWVIYNWVIFHDPLLSFFYGSRSHTFFADKTNLALPARGHPVTALETYGLTVAGTVGWLLLPAALLGLFMFVRRRRLRSSTLPAYLTLVPFAFYVLVLYKGANTESLPQLGQGQYYNIRFGLAMIPAVGLFCACLALTRRRLLSGVLVCSVLALTVASALIGWAGTPYVEREALYGPSGLPTETAGKHDAAWLAAHYHGGNVLITYVNNQTMIFYLLTKHQFADRAFITDANGSQFDRALAHPETSVRWIVMNSDATNGASQIWTALHRDTAWQQHFALIATFGTTQIYERVDDRAAEVASGGPAAAPGSAAATAPAAAHAFAGRGEAELAPAPAL